MILLTSFCWWLYDDDWFEMLVAESLPQVCLRLFSLLYPESVTNIPNVSSTHLVSNSRHQHQWSRLEGWKIVEYNFLWNFRDSQSGKTWSAKDLNSMFSGIYEFSGMMNDKPFYKEFSRNSVKINYDFFRLKPTAF